MLLFIIIVGASLVIGYIVERLTLRILSSSYEKTKWIGNEIILNSLKRVIVILFGLIGITIAVKLAKIPSNIENFLSTLFSILAILAVTFSLTKIAIGFIEYYTQQVKDVVVPTSNLKIITRIVFFSTAFLLILNAMGISTAPILTALGIGGLATALALQDTLSNLFAGFYISLTKHIKPGHFIRLENGFEGYVHDIGWRHTKVYSKEGKIILIPNTKIWSLIVTNYSLPDTLSTVEIKLSISNKNDIKRVEEIIYSVGKEIIIRTEGCLPESNIEITYSSFSDTTINLVLTLKTKDSKYNTFVKAAFLKELNNKFLQENFISYTLS